MPKYWGKQIFAHGRFPEVGQKQKTERKKEERKKDWTTVKTMAKLRIAHASRLGQNICRAIGAAIKNGLVLNDFSVFQLFKIYFPIIQVSQFDFAPWSCNRPQYVLAWTLSPPSTPLTEGCLKKLMVCSPYCLISPGFFSYSSWCNCWRCLL